MKSQWSRLVIVEILDESPSGLFSDAKKSVSEIKKVNKCVVMLSENSNGTVMHTALCHKRVMQAIMMIWYWLSWYMDPWGRGTVSLCQAETLVHFLSLSLFCLDSFQLLHCWGIVTGGNYASSWFGGTMTDALSLCCNLTFNLGKLKNPAWWQVE